MKYDRKEELDAGFSFLGNIMKIMILIYLRGQDSGWGRGWEVLLARCCWQLNGCTYIELGARPLSRTSPSSGNGNSRAAPYMVHSRGLPSCPHWQCPTESEGVLSTLYTSKLPIVEVSCPRNRPPCPPWRFLYYTCVLTTMEAPCPLPGVPYPIYEAPYHTRYLVLC